MIEIEKEKIKELQKKIEQIKKEKKVDLSSDEDLSLAIMNLVSLEEHFFFTAEKTGKNSYLELLQETREIRKFLLAQLVPHHEGETWCISKHLLAATMRIMEVGTKLLGDEKKEEAKKMFDLAYKIYSLFWGIRLKLINLDEVKKITDDKLNVHDNSNGKKPWTFEDIMNKLINCCDE